MSFPILKNETLQSNEITLEIKKKIIDIYSSGGCVLSIKHSKDICDLPQKGFISKNTANQVIKEIDSILSFCSSTMSADVVPQTAEDLKLFTNVSLDYEKDVVYYIIDKMIERATKEGTWESYLEYYNLLKEKRNEYI